MSWNTSFAGQNPFFFCLNISTYLKYHANSYGFNSNLSTCYRHLQLCIPSMLHAAFLLYFKGNYWGSGGIATFFSCTPIFAFLTPSSFLFVCLLKDGFIGFGGNVIREKVKENSPWFVTSFQELLDELKVSN